MHKCFDVFGCATKEPLTRRFILGNVMSVLTWSSILKAMLFKQSRNVRCCELTHLSIYFFVCFCHFICVCVVDILELRILPQFQQ